MTAWRRKPRSGGHRSLEALRRHLVLTGKHTVSLTPRQAENVTELERLHENDHRWLHEQEAAS